MSNESRAALAAELLAVLDQMDAHWEREHQRCQTAGHPTEKQRDEWIAKLRQLEGVARYLATALGLTNARPGELPEWRQIEAITSEWVREATSGPNVMAWSMPTIESWSMGPLRDACEAIIAAEAPRATDVGAADDATDHELPALTSEDAKIIRALLSAAPMLMTQEEIEDKTHVSRRCVGDRLKGLRAAGYTHRPKGKKGGEGLTERGERAAKSLPPDEEI